MSQPITLTLARRAPRHTGSLAILVLVALLVLPFFALLPADNPLSISTYTLTLLGKILCYAVMAVARWISVWGYAGLLSLGHGLFFALGGYAMGMYLMRQAQTECQRLCLFSHGLTCGSGRAPSTLPGRCA